MSFENWKEYIQTPEGGYAKVNNSATPSRLKSLQNHHSSNERKRGPSTPLTPTLIQKNIVKKQYSSHERFDAIKNINKAVVPIKSDGHFEEVSSKENELLDDEIKRQEYAEQYIFTHSNRGSPTLKKPTPLSSRKSDQLNTEFENMTPKIRKGIKLAVRESKKSRLQIVKDLHVQDNPSDSEYSEVSDIAGDTPNYKFQDQNLIYYKNGYYLNNDDSVYEFEKENIINAKELTRVNDLLEFMKLERQFETD